jgi:hypothetical protein
LGGGLVLFGTNPANGVCSIDHTVPPDGSTVAHMMRVFAAAIAALATFMLAAPAHADTDGHSGDSNMPAHRTAPHPSAAPSSNPADAHTALGGSLNGASPNPPAPEARAAGVDHDRFTIDPRRRRLASVFDLHAQAVEDEGRKILHTVLQIEDARPGANLSLEASSLEAERQAIIRDVLAASDLLFGGPDTVATQEFVAQLNRNFQIIYDAAQSGGASAGVDQAFRNIVNMLHGLRDDLLRDAIDDTHN